MAESDLDENDDSAEGWDAITTACERIYPEQKTPRHYGAVPHFVLGGKDPLDGISVYLHNDGDGSSHWHWVGYGMSELYLKDSEDKEYSGWGFEFTFRLKKDPAENDPPSWPWGLLQNLARYVIRSRNPFSPGHYMRLNGPIALGRDTLIHAVMFAEDPELRTIDTPHGKVQFLLVVGATMDELAAARAWNAEDFLSCMRASNPCLVTDLNRQSILSDPAIASEVLAATERDGSSTGMLAIDGLRIDEGSAGDARTLVIGASSIHDLRVLLRGRTAFGRTFTIVSATAKAQVAPAEKFAWILDDEKKTVAISLPRESALALAEILEPKRGEYRISELPQLTIRVIPSEIKDSTGKTVVEVIG